MSHCNRCFCKLYWVPWHPYIDHTKVSPTKNSNTILACEMAKRTRPVRTPAAPDVTTLAPLGVLLSSANCEANWMPTANCKTYPNSEPMGLQLPFACCVVALQLLCQIMTWPPISDNFFLRKSLAMGTKEHRISCFLFVCINPLSMKNPGRQDWWARCLSHSKPSGANLFTDGVCGLKDRDFVILQVAPKWQVDLHCTSLAFRLLHPLPCWCLYQLKAPANRGRDMLC